MASSFAAYLSIPFQVIQRNTHCHVRIMFRNKFRLCLYEADMRPANECLSGNKFTCIWTIVRAACCSYVSRSIQNYQTGVKRKSKHVKICFAVHEKPCFIYCKSAKWHPQSIKNMLLESAYHKSYISTAFIAITIISCPNNWHFNIKNIFGAVLFLQANLHRTYNLSFSVQVIRCFFGLCSITNFTSCVF